MWELKKRKGNNNSVSKPSTPLHKLCGTLQSLNRMTFKNVTNRTVLVPHRAHVWATAEEPQNHSLIHATSIVVYFHSSFCLRKKKQWINQEMNFGNKCNHPDNIFLSRVFCSFWAAVQFLSISLLLFTLVSQPCGVCDTFLSRVWVAFTGAAAAVCVCVCEMTTQPSGATPCNTTAVTKDQPPACHTPGAAS